MRQITFYGNKNIMSAIIADARKSKNISQAELAAKLQTMNVNIDQQIISKIEKNQRQLTDYEFAAICIALEIDTNSIIKAFRQISK